MVLKDVMNIARHIRVLNEHEQYEKLLYYSILDDIQTQFFEISKKERQTI